MQSTSPYHILYMMEGVVVLLVCCYLPFEICTSRWEIKICSKGQEEEMKIIKPYAKMLPPAGNYLDSDDFTLGDGENLLEHIEWCARISHRSEEAVKPGSWEKIIEHVVMKHGDWSVVEHATVSVDMVVDRGITHEWVRHRLNAFTQESTRFVNYEKKMPPSFIYPILGVECKHCLMGSQPHEDLTAWFHVAHGQCPYDSDWLQAIDFAEKQYKRLLAKKWSPQNARSVFPNALASRIITTSNLRNWRHMFIMRTSAQAHPQMRQVMIPLLREFQEKIPMLFDDVVPELQQSEAISKAR